MSPSSSKISGASLPLARPWKEKEEKLTELEVQFILENKAWACVLPTGKYIEYPQIMRPGLCEVEGDVGVRHRSGPWPRVRKSSSPSYKTCGKVTDLFIPRWDNGG